MSDSKIINYRVSNMKLLCAFMVVVVHSQFLGSDNASRWLRELVSYGICRIAVPFFFVVSGYYLARHMGETGWFMRETVKRVRSLGVTYLASVLLFMVLSYIIVWAMVGRDNVPTVMTIVNDIGANPSLTPLLGPMWYVRALFLLILISPFLKLLICERKIGILSVCAFGLILFVFRPYSGCSYTVWYRIFNYGFSLEGLFYFSLGIFLQKHPLKELSRTTGVILLVIGISLFVARAYFLIHTNDHWFACQLGFFAIPCTLYGIYRVTPTIMLGDILRAASFPIFVLHFFILSLLGGRISRGGGGWFQPDSSVVNWLLRIFVAFFGSILIAQILSKQCPSLYRLFFGDRK